jgi:hypothetical protein
LGAYGARGQGLRPNPSPNPNANPNQVRTTLEGKVSNLIEYPGYAVVVCMCIAVALDQVKRARTLS